MSKVSKPRGMAIWCNSCGRKVFCRDNGKGLKLGFCPSCKSRVEQLKEIVGGKLKITTSATKDELLK